jgi:hypothetical protein
MFKNNFYRSNYLSKCDLLNKYLLLDVYSCPKVDVIKLNISLVDLLNEQNDYNELHTKMRTFIVFFLFTFNVPFLKYQNFIKYNKISYTSNAMDFKLFLNFSKKKIINNFLISLFLENAENLELNSSLFPIKSIFSDSGNNLKIRLGLPLNNLYSMSYLTSSSFFSTNSKEISISTDMVLKNKNLGNKEHLFKNLLFFWLL